MLSGRIVEFRGPSPDTPLSEIEERLELEHHALFVALLLGCEERKARRMIAGASTKALRLMVS